MSTNYCAHCGTKLSKKNTFCTGCGKRNIKKYFPIGWIIVVLILIIFGVWLFSDAEDGVGSNIEDSVYETIMKTFKENDYNPTSVGIASSVVNVLCPYEGEPMAFDSAGTGGSGVVIDQNGTVLTNSHIIPQGDDYIDVNDLGCLVVFPDEDTGLPLEAYYAEPYVFQGLSDDYDLAWLMITGAYEGNDGVVYGTYPKEFPSAFQRDCEDEQVKLGEKVIIYGYPQATGGYSLTITEGVVSAFTANGIVTSAKIDHGNSGGLATDDKGCFIGIPTSVTLGEAESYGAIISTEDIIDFFNQTSNLSEEDI